LYQHNNISFILTKVLGGCDELVEVLATVESKLATTMAVKHAKVGGASVSGYVRENGVGILHF
jgi:hypothetical protein